MRTVLDRGLTRVDELESGALSDASRVELEAIRMEANTWGLLQALMPCVDPSFPLTRSQMSVQRPKNGARAPSQSTHPSHGEPIPPDVDPRASDYARVAYAHRTRHRARVATRYRLSTATSRSHHRILEIYEAQRDAGVTHGEGDTGGPCNRV